MFLVCTHAEFFSPWQIILCVRSTLRANNHTFCKMDIGQEQLPAIHIPAYFHIISHHYTHARSTARPILTFSPKYIGQTGEQPKQSRPNQLSNLTLLSAAQSPIAPARASGETRHSLLPSLLPGGKFRERRDRLFPDSPGKNLKIREEGGALPWPRPAAPGPSAGCRGRCARSRGPAKVSEHQSESSQVRLQWLQNPNRLQDVLLTQPQVKRMTCQVSILTYMNLKDMNFEGNLYLL